MTKRIHVEMTRKLNDYVTGLPKKFYVYLHPDFAETSSFKYNKPTEKANEDTQDGRQWYGCSRQTK